MVYKLDDVSHLEKMSELKENAPIIPEVKLFEEPTTPASLDKNILTLCSKLRSEGFSKYADSLETKFLTLKLAAKTHLYNTHDESGEDLIQSAHPDGDLSIGDASDGHGVIQNNVNRHKKIVDIISKEPIGKLASYVLQCKTALADFLGDSEDTRKFQDKFGVFVTNFLPDLNAVIIALRDFQDAKLVNGKTVADYNIMVLPEVFSSWIRSGEWATSSGAKRIIAGSDTLIKKLYDLIDQIDKTIDSGSQEFPNKKFPDVAYARLNTHREAFLSLYAEFNKDTGAAQWHGQFISSDALQTKIFEITTKLNSINVRIDRHILEEPSFKSLPKFIAWVKSAKEYITNIINQLNGMVELSRKYVDDMSKIHRGSDALIDANKLKEFLHQENSKIDTSDQTNDANIFIKSFDKIYTDTLSAIINAVNNTNIESNIKNNVMGHFNDK